MERAYNLVFRYSHSHRLLAPPVLGWVGAVPRSLGQASHLALLSSTHVVPRGGMYFSNTYQVYQKIFFVGFPRDVLCMLTCTLRFHMASSMPALSLEHLQPCYSKALSTILLSGNLLETQNLGPTPDRFHQNLHFNKILGFFLKDIKVRED